MTGSIVSMLLEGASFDDFTCGTSLTVTEANELTLENGAEIIARKSVEELHELFELSVVATNEAALGAYMEGCTDVLESATYGPVYESAEKSFGQKVLDFLKKLKDRVFGFFQQIAAKLSSFVSDYNKFFLKNKDKMLEAQNNRKNPLKVKVKNWNDKKIESIVPVLKDAATNISELASEVVSIIEKYHSAGDGEKHSSDKYKKTLELTEVAVKNKVNKVLANYGIGAGSSDFDTVKLNETCAKAFLMNDSEKTIELTVEYVRANLMGTKDSADKVKEAQKAFNKAYDEAIKTVKKVTSGDNSFQGYSTYVNKATTAMNRIQTITNAYASAGFRALIGRANEAKSLCHVIISGNAGKRDASK